MRGESEITKSVVSFSFTFALAYCLFSGLLFWWSSPQGVSLGDIDRFARPSSGLGGTTVGAFFWPEMIWAFFFQRMRLHSNHHVVSTTYSIIVGLFMGSSVSSVLFGTWHWVSPSVSWDLYLVLCGLVTFSVTLVAVWVSSRLIFPPAGQ